MSDDVLPAGTLLCHLDEIAESLNLTAECDNLLRSAIPARYASVFVRQLKEGGFQDAPPNNDWNEYISTSVNDANMTVESSSESLLTVYVKNNHLNADVASSCSVVQVMELIDDFSSRCGLSRIGDQELKFGVPLDHLCGLMAGLLEDPGFLACEKRDFFVVSKCKSIRHKIGFRDNKLLSIAKLNRSTHSTPSLPDEDSVIEQYRFTETFPLYHKSILKNSGPEVVIALSLTAIEGIIARWSRQFNTADHAKFIETYPFDCVVRAIRAHPNSLRQARELIAESLKTPRRFKCCSGAVLKEVIATAVRDNGLSEEVHHLLSSEISATYAYLIVFKQINKTDSRALSKGGKWITVGRLQPYRTGKRKRIVELNEGKSPRRNSSLESSTYDV